MCVCVCVCVCLWVCVYPQALDFEATDGLHTDWPILHVLVLQHVVHFKGCGRALQLLPIQHLPLQLFDWLKQFSSTSSAKAIFYHPFACRHPALWSAETVFINRSAKVIFHHSFASPPIVCINIVQICTYRHTQTHKILCNIWAHWHPHINIRQYIYILTHTRTHKWKTNTYLLTHTHTQFLHTDKHKYGATFLHTDTHTHT